MFSLPFSRSRRERSRGSILFGALLIWVGMTALWKNEVRFDLVGAAEDTLAVYNAHNVYPGDNFSYSGRLDPGLTIPGQYVAPMRGYMAVERVAEIYAWDRESRSDGPDRWTLRWQSRPESNSRNSHLQQRLQSAQLLPPDYALNDLRIDPQSIRFVDPYRVINPGQLQWRDSRLRPASHSREYFHFPASGATAGGPQLGDERLSYRAIPVPPVATYFGRFDGEQGVVDDSQRRAGLINDIIQNEGILHHLVSGERDTALESIAADQARLTLIVRLVGTVATVLGVHLLLAKVFGLLLMLPFIGALVERALFLVSCVIGVALAGLTIATGYAVAHPLVPIGLCAAIAAAIYTLRQRARGQSNAAREQVQIQYRSQLTHNSLAEIEFIELARLAALDSEIGDGERAMLMRWGRERGWSAERCESLIAKAAESDGGFLPRDSTPVMIANLVRIALADGTLSSRELDRIKAIAHRADVDDQLVNALIRQTQRSMTTAAP